MFVIGSPQSKMGIQMKHEQGWVERSSYIYSTQTPAHKMVFQSSQTENKNRLKILSLSRIHSESKICRKLQRVPRRTHGATATALLSTLTPLRLKIRPRLWETQKSSWGNGLIELATPPYNPKNLDWKNKFLVVLFWSKKINKFKRKFGWSYSTWYRVVLSKFDVPSKVTYL